MAKKTSKTGEIMLTYMRKAGMNQRELATAVGTSGSNISAMISGARSGRGKILPKVVEILKIPRSEFPDFSFLGIVSSPENQNILPLIKKVTESGIAQISFQQLNDLFRIEELSQSANSGMTLTPRAIKEMLDGQKTE